MHNVLKQITGITATYKEPYPDIHMIDFKLVNSYIIANVGMYKYNWVIVDTGIDKSAMKIIKIAEKLFGVIAKPLGIFLTSSSETQTCGLNSILKRWNVPVYAHEDEIPFLNIDKNISSVDLVALKNEGNVPCMPEWRYLHTPGYREGHLSLYRESDQVLLVGSSFSNQLETTAMNNLIKKIGNFELDEHLFLNPESSKLSLEKLYKLSPRFALFNHGKQLSGDKLMNYFDLLIKRNNTYITADPSLESNHP